MKPFTPEGYAKYPIGQIIFDMNGEYANANLQDAGTAIFDLYKDKTIRYSTIEKPGFRVLKINFFKEIENGFELLRSHPAVREHDGQFVKNFRSVDLSPPDQKNKSAVARYDRLIAVYKCILHKAKFDVPAGTKISFSANQEVREYINDNVDPSKGISIDTACAWWESFWEKYDLDEDDVFKNYKKKHPDNKEWASDELKALLVILTRRRRSGGSPDCGGYTVLNELNSLHTGVLQVPFDKDILDNLREGKIVIIDLSNGDEEIQRMYSERITKYIFRDSMTRFTETKPNNFIQFYFEEAHNLFPKQTDKDLSQIYNKVAKEGAKLHLGLVFATQEVSSISGNILKNTQNWFISHLNNADEIKELRKYYDFSDFSDSLIKFSQDTDKGFARVKTYSNAFVIPMQVDRFAPEKTENGDDL